MPATGTGNAVRRSPKYVPLRYLRNRRDFGRLDAGTNSQIWVWPEDGNSADLRAAVFQHLVVRTARPELRRHLYLASLAERGQLQLAHLYRAMRGEVGILARELAAIGAVSVHALPSGHQLYSAMYYATVTLKYQVTASGGQPGNLRLAELNDSEGTVQMLGKDLTAEELAQEQLLAALAGHRIVFETKEDRLRAERLTRTVRPILARVAIQLAHAAGLACGKPTRHIHMWPVNETASSPGIVGDPTTDGPLLIGHLPEDWITSVHEQGWSVIDDTFIVAITELDSEGRPECRPYA